jgi:hypothetical protein
MTRTDFKSQGIDIPKIADGNVNDNAHDYRFKR